MDQTMIDILSQKSKQGNAKENLILEEKINKDI